MDWSNADMILGFLHGMVGCACVISLAMAVSWLRRYLRLR